MDITMYTAKHEVIKQELKAIENLVCTSVEDNAMEIATAVVRLGSVVKMHLSSEDKFFYPELLKKDDQTKTIACFYMKEMDDLYGAFTDFSERWNTPSKVKENINCFEKDFKAIGSALIKRMEREEAELYPLA